MRTSDNDRTTWDGQKQDNEKQISRKSEMVLNMVHQHKRRPPRCYWPVA